MKNKLLLLVTAFCISSTVLFSQNDSSILKLKGVKVENDYHKNITWIKSKPIALVQKDFTVSAYDCSYIQLYFGLYMEDSVQKITPIRIVNAYNKSEWIFFDEISYLLGSKKEVREGKGKVFKLYDKETNRKVKNGVTERSDVVASKSILELIEYIINNPVTRMECKYINNNKNEAYVQKVYDGTKKLKKHFTSFVEAYNQVTEHFLLENVFDNE